MEQINEEFEEYMDSNSNEDLKNKENSYNINDILNDSNNKKMSNLNDNFEYINELKDIPSNENSEKEADVDENAKNFMDSEVSAPEKESEKEGEKEKENKEKIISIPISIKEQINESPKNNTENNDNKIIEDKKNENKSEVKEEGKDIEKEEKGKEIPNPAEKKVDDDEDRLFAFNEMRKNISEINNNKINDLKSSLKNKNDLGKKLLNNSFGAKEAIKMKFNDTNSSESSNIIENKEKSKHKKKSSSEEEEEEEDNINMAGLGYFMPYKKNKGHKKGLESEESKSSENNFLQKVENESSESIHKNEKENKNEEINNEKEKSKSIIQNKFNNNKINFPLKKNENENSSNQNNSEENKMEDISKHSNSNISDENADNNKNIVNIYLKPKPQNLNDILKRTEDEDENNNINNIINEKDDEKNSKLKQIIDESNNESLSFNLNLNDGFKIKNNYTDNRRYNSEEELIYNDNTNSERKTEEQINNEKIIQQLTDEMTKNITEEIANNILDDILSSEIKDEKSIVKKKKDLNLLNTSNLSNNTANNHSNRSTSPKHSSNLSACSSSPGRNKTKTVNKDSSNLVNNKYNNFIAISSPSIRDEDSLINTSVFMKTVQEIKKDSQLYFYNKNILPKFLEIIKKEINNKYFYILRDLKVPLKIDEEKLMVELSTQITFKKIFDKNSKFDINVHYLNEKINENIYLDEKILTKFNEENNFDEETQNLNKCIFDTVNEIIRNKRIYGKLGEPLLWSLRSKEIEFKYKDTKFFKDIFIDNIIKEVNNLANYKIGLISENYEHLNSSQFSKDREKKFNTSINKELKEDQRWENYDEEETIIKLMATKLIMNQLLNEVVEILEHVHFSRKKPEKYNYKSIFSCENIPLLSFQTDIANKINKKAKNEEIEEDYEDEDHKSEDRINQ